MINVVFLRTQYFGGLNAINYSWASSFAQGNRKAKPETRESPSATPFYSPKFLVTLNPTAGVQMTKDKSISFLTKGVSSEVFP